MHAQRLQLKENVKIERLYCECDRRYSLESNGDPLCALRVVALELFIASHGVRFRAADVVELMVPINEKAGRCKKFWNDAEMSIGIHANTKLLANGSALGFSKTHLDRDLSSIPLAGS